jgi:adenylate kinase family enzyme/uridine kinase
LQIFFHFVELEPNNLIKIYKFEGIIGIGGSTRSGKTTLSRALFNHYSRQNDTIVYHIGQDAYFKAIKPKYLFGTLSFDNWECPEAVDFDRFYSAIIDTKNEAREKLRANTQYKEALIIVEGFLLFHEERIVSLLNVKYFIAIPKQLCHERRLKANTKWKFPEPHFEEYFALLIWPGYVRYNKCVCLMKDVQVIDGLHSKEQILDRVLHELKIQMHAPGNRTLFQRSFSRVVFALGRPGAGKGALCEELKVKYHIEHLSVGDLLRAEVTNNGPNAEAIKKSIDLGVLISKEISLSLLRNVMEKLNAESQARNQLNANFIIDGYPSSLDRAESFEQMFGPCDVILHLSCESDIVKQRLLARGRSDDTEQCIQNRLNTFTENMVPVVEHYTKLNRVAEIDASQSKEYTLQQAERILFQYDVLRDKTS